MSDTVATPSQERRRYFRVTDLVGLKYRVLNQGEAELAKQSQPTSLKSLLAQMEAQIETSMVSIKAVSPDVHQVLDLLNQKINLAFGHGVLAQEVNDIDNTTKACQVNLSACGIAFPAQEALDLNQHIALELTLYPSNAKLNLLAAAISCEDLEEPAEGNTHLIRADFVDMSDIDQEVLVQHVIKRQVSELKSSRQIDD